jgi:hypothetical protein
LNDSKDSGRSSRSSSISSNGSPKRRRKRSSSGNTTSGNNTSGNNTSGTNTSGNNNNNSGGLAALQLQVKVEELEKALNEARLELREGECSSSLLILVSQYFWSI